MKLKGVYHHAFVDLWIRHSHIFSEEYHVGILGLMRLDQDEYSYGFV